MNEKSISHCQGKGSLAHNNREFHPKNVDSSRTPDNITFVKEPIAEAYEKLFGAAVERYNAKQKRSDRKIKTGYFEYQFDHKISQYVITSSDKRKSFYEDVVQIGTMFDTGVNTPDAETAVKCLTEYMNGFQARSPNFYVFNAVLHLDEATPHLHIDYIPVGHYTRGVDTQNGIAQALKEMGYGYGKDAIARWRQSEYETLREICIRNGLVISEPKKSRGSLKNEEYKALEAEKARLEKELKPLREMSLAAEESSISGTKIPLSNKTVIEQTELEKLQLEKKAAVVQKAENEKTALELSSQKEQLDLKAEQISEEEKSAFEKLRSAQKEKSEADSLMSKAEAKMEKAQNLYDAQISINQILADTKKELRAEQEKSENLEAVQRDIAGTVHLPRYSKPEEIISECSALVKENREYRLLVINEVKPSYRDTPTPEMLMEHIGKIKDSSKELEAENAEKVTAMENLKKRFDFMRGIFIKVMNAMGMFTLSKQYEEHLSRKGKSLADAIRIFAYDKFEDTEDKVISYEIRRPQIDGEILELANDLEEYGDFSIPGEEQEQTQYTERYEH